LFFGHDLFALLGLALGFLAAGFSADSDFALALATGVAFVVAFAAAFFLVGAACSCASWS